MIELTEDQKEFLRVSAEYAEMTKMPAWKHIWGFMEEYSARAEAAMEQSVSTDPETVRGLTLEWRARRRFLGAVDTQIRTAIGNRAAIMAEFAELMGATEQQIEEIYEKEKMVNG